MSGNLKLIKKTTISGSTTSVSITDVFSSDFEVYKITAKEVLQPASSSASSLHVRLINSSGSIESTSGHYLSAFKQLRADSSFFEGNSTTDTFMNIMLGQVDDNINSMGAVMYLFNPFDSTKQTHAMTQSATLVGSQHRNIKGIGLFNQTTSITGLNIHVSSDAINSGIITIYGLGNE